MDTVKLDNYNYLFWEEYKGKVQLTVGYMTKNGEVKAKYIQQEFGKGNWKQIPFRITFNSEEEAIKQLDELKAILATPF